jgi:hypothetical protein
VNLGSVGPGLVVWQEFAGYRVAAQPAQPAALPAIQMGTEAASVTNPGVPCGCETRGSHISYKIDFQMVVGLSALRTGCPLPPRRFPTLVSVRG